MRNAQTEHVIDYGNKYIHVVQYTVDLVVRYFFWGGEGAGVRTIKHWRYAFSNSCTEWTTIMA